MVKRILYIILFAIGIANTTNASHIVGGYINYEYTGTGTDYKFRIKLYRDCGGISAPSAVILNFSSVSCGLNFTNILTLVDSSQIPTNSCAGFAPSYCQGGTIFGYEEYIFESIINVPPCSDWVVNYNICCRNGDVTNVINPDSYSMHVETTFNNLDFPGNSSPQFNTTPISYYCVGVPSFKDYSAIDVDGDSLHYEFVPILSEPNIYIPFKSGYTYNQPLAVNNTTVLNEGNGMMSFTPSMLQLSLLAIQVSEYRNGALIGTIRVDDEIIVANGIVNPDTISGRVYIDFNSNQVFDLGDEAVSGTIVEMNPGNVITSTAIDGKYNFYIVNGTWNISIPNLPLYTYSTTSSINLNSNTFTSSLNNDFIVDVVQNMNDLEIYLNQVGSPIPGNTYPLHITYKNTGTVVHTNVEVTITLDPLFQFVNSIPTPTTVFGNTLTYTIPLLQAFNSGNIQINTTVNTSASIGTPVFCSANITPLINDLTPGNNSDILSDTIIVSCDPNFKEVFPNGDVELSFIAAQNWLTYTIHFQNLGTAPAQIIRIQDFLDHDLEISSLELIATSFPCTQSIKSPNLLEFEFNGINLPAAIVNEPASHGFVEYRIRPKSTLVSGNLITNGAGIYFDFNSPIYTNIVHNRVVTTVGVAENNIEYDPIAIYPNPSSTYCTLEINSIDSHNLQIEIYNILGTLLNTFGQEVSAGLNLINIQTNDFSAGIYFIFVKDQSRKQILKFSVVR